jgi:hypothetical protein
MVNYFYNDLRLNSKSDCFVLAKLDHPYEVPVHHGAKNIWNTMMMLDAQQRAQASSISSSNYNQIAYNPRTGGIGVITGQIIVSYTGNFDAESIGLSYSMQLVQDFAHLKTAFYTVNNGQDIFLITNSLNESGLVSKAEVEVIENFAVPM